MCTQIYVSWRTCANGHMHSIFEKQIYMIEFGRRLRYFRPQRNAKIHKFDETENFPPVSMSIWWKVRGTYICGIQCGHLTDGYARLPLTIHLEYCLMANTYIDPHRRNQAPTPALRTVHTLARDTNFCLENTIRNNMITFYDVLIIIITYLPFIRWWRNDDDASEDRSMALALGMLYGCISRTKYTKYTTENNSSVRASAGDG